MLESYLLKLHSPNVIFFPKEEWNSVQKRLDANEEVSSVRNSCGSNKRVFKVGQIYNTPWNVKIKITKCKYFSNPENIPTWNKMNKTMKDSVLHGIKMCGIDNLQWIHLKKLK